MDPRTIESVNEYDRSESAQAARRAKAAWHDALKAVQLGNRAAVRGAAARAWKAADDAREYARAAVADPEYSDGAVISNQGQTAHDRAQANALIARDYARKVESYIR